MSRLTEFLQDKSGKYSMMRLTTIILVVGGLVFGFMYPDPEHYMFGIQCVLLGLGGKGVQKYMECQDKSHGHDSIGSK